MIPYANECSLMDTTDYFFSSLDRLFAPNYIPTDEDILRCRVKTTGIKEIEFHIAPLTYHVVDVGGQRSERKKWIHCFQNVTGLLFVVSMSGYNQVLVEDRSTNQINEALMIFGSLVNAEWFIETNIVLILNKLDLFRKKLPMFPLSLHFPDYKGPDSDVEKASQYLKRRFEALNRNPNKAIYTHFTYAVDASTNHVKRLMTSVHEMILENNYSHARSYE
jgi:guanine nucleotide-binding protein subunit alpha